MEQDNKIKRIVANVLRYFVGTFFIFSGLTKLNDPLGLAYKMGEYFAPDVLNLTFLNPFVVSFSIIVITVEIMLGILLILGRLRTFTIWSLMVMDIYFTFLTFYSAAFDKVTHCGCFGDVIPLTSWWSFGKDVVLLVLIGTIIWLQRFIKPIVGFRTMLVIMALSLSLTLGSMYYVLHNLPFMDFRPYKVGVDIKKDMSIPEDAEKDVYENIWIYNVNGEDKNFSDADKPWEIEGAKFVDRKTNLVKKGYTPPIVDFSIKSQFEDDLTDFYLSQDSLTLVIAYDLSKSDKEAWEEIQNYVEKNKKQAIILTATSGDELLNYLSDNNIKIEAFFCDPITLKTIIRANPGVVNIEKGVVKEKINWRNL